MINKYSNEPLYCQLKSIILTEIENSKYPEDSKIPSEMELCEKYGISRPTVRQAISELTNSGHLYKVRGKGTFVSKSKESVDIKDYSGFTDSILDSQNPDSRILINVSLIKDSQNEKLRSIFNIPNAKYGKIDFAEVVYQIKNGNDAYSLNKSYIPMDLFPDIVEHVKTSQLPYIILKGKYPLIPAKSKSIMEIIYSSQEDTRYLQVQEGQQLINIQNILYSKNGQAVEYIIAKYRADKCRFIFENLSIR